jgi:DhnA family fructose-bisphosphate aldolase class Ia
MPYGKALRLRRILGSDRSVIVAIDHGNVAGVVRGLENPVEVVKTVAQSSADGILITPGILEQAANEVGKLAVILRLDGCVSTLGEGPLLPFMSVEQAVAMGADGVVINATLGAPYESAELEKVGRIASEGRRWGMPVVAEMLSQRMMANHMDMSGSGDDSLPGDIGKDVALAARIGVELGADAIKTRYSGDPDSFREAVIGAGRPVLVAGGPRRDSTVESMLRLVEEVLEAGASGVVFGRLIWQQADPLSALKAVCAMVQDDATFDEALEIVAG